MRHITSKRGTPMVADVVAQLQESTILFEAHIGTMVISTAVLCSDGAAEASQTDLIGGLSLNAAPTAGTNGGICRRGTTHRGLSRDNVHHASHRIRTIEHGGWTTQHLNTFSHQRQIAVGQRMAIDALILRQGYPPEKRFFIDLRGNTGGDLEQAALSASFFLPAGSTVYSYYDRDSESVYKTQQAGRYGGRPFIIMQDGYTASSAEMFINALKTGMKNVSTYGEQTYGKARVQKNFKLKSGAVLKLTVGELQYQDYTGTWESSGIAPDVVSRKDKEDGS